MLGNSYWAEQGVPILAHVDTAHEIEEHGFRSLEGMKRYNRDQAEGTFVAPPTQTFEDQKIIEMGDFVNVMLRTILIPANAKNQADARVMVDFLTGLNDRSDLVAASGLPGIDAAALQENPALRPIRFGPGLLVFLDQIKRQNFLRSWESSLVQE